MWACKKNTPTKETSKIKEPEISKTDTIFKNDIKVFNVSFDSLYVKNTEVINKLNNVISSSFNEHKVVNDEPTLKRRLEGYRSKSFAKILARDFENENFIKAINFNISFLSEKDVEFPRRIVIEEWSFKDAQTAKLCFDSFEDYKEKGIHLVAFNWIWILQKNKLFLISSLYCEPESKPMQLLKSELIKLIGEKYKSIEMSSR